ncbi:PINIT domain-containing protein [Coniochaeta sp. 2T2.1]|nr:PINIT domain-containing protein [Coniochaeta sp. 2T2.1]
MASSSIGPSRDDVAGLCRVAQTPGISKPQLQNICVVNGLAKTGNKADLQRRIVNLIQDSERSQDIQRFNEIKASIYNNAPVQANAYRPFTNLANQSPLYSPAAPGPAHTNMAPNGYAANGYGGAGAVNAQRPYAQTFDFKRSPFYEIVARVGEVRTCDVMSQHRQTVNVHVRVADYPVLNHVNNDPSLKVMAFCAAGNTGVQEITFPWQSELKVNGGDIKANLRGLKNKPGSTRPADLTSHLRLKPPTYNNNVEFTYALTSKKFYFGIYVCRVTPIDQLVEKIQKSKRIAKDSVIHELTKKASDQDVVATSQNISLKDPLSYMRLVVPCRGLKCNHIQCFDATAYLQLQEQGPQWLCPICSNPAPFEHLAVDEYVKDILTNTPLSVEQVTIEPDGRWLLPSAQNEQKNQPQAETSFVDDDDLVAGNVSSRQSTAATPNRSAYQFSTPAQESSREGSSMPPRSTTSSKRPAAEVIDLTLSDDDEPRPVKRANTNQGNGFNGWAQ